MKEDREDLVKHILELAEEIYIKLTPGFPAEWLSSDITMAQLRVLLILQTEGPTRMSTIATNTGTALSTATGIVDNLVKKGLVLRDINPQDRRLVICKLSTKGQEIMNKIWVQGQFQIKRLLDGLDLKQLRQASQVAEFILVNI